MRYHQVHFKACNVTHCVQFAAQARISTLRLVLAVVVVVVTTVISDPSTSEKQLERKRPASEAMMR
jgi:hypothetical protein